MQRFYRVLFIFILFFLIIPTAEIYSKKKKNLNIKKAQEYIKEKKFNDATKLLQEELVKDPDSEYMVMKLLDQISKERDKIVSMIYLVKENIEIGEYEKAEEILVQLESGGDFDPTINKLRAIIISQKEPLKKINIFNNYVTKDAENSILKYELENALVNYKKAIDVYRNDLTDDSDRIFNEAVRKFNAAENRLISSGADKDWIDKQENTSYENIVLLNNQMIERSNRWKSIENDFLEIERLLNNVKPLTKKMITYEAYKSITEKYIYLLRRSIQRDGKIIQTYTLELINKNISSFKKDLTNDTSDIKKYYSLLLELEKSSFYKILINFDKEYLTERSTLNTKNYLEYITAKNVYFIKINEIDAWKDFETANKLYNDSVAKKQERDLFKAKEIIIDSQESLNKSSNIKDEINNLLKKYENYKGKEFTEFISKNKQLNQKSEDLNNKQNKLLSDLNSQLSYAEKLLEEADSAFKKSVNFYNAQTFSKAKSSFEETYDKYAAVLVRLESDYVNDQIKKVNDYLDKIKTISYKVDMVRADEFLEKTKNDFYSESYENAKKYIDEVEVIYKNYNEDMELVNYWQDRISTALKIRSGSKLSIDDSAYEEIIELMKNAEDTFNNKNYDKAHEYILKVLSEKPYYEDARLFEIKILKNKDREIFLKIFDNYFNEAKNKFNRKNYSDAYIAFNQLLQFGERSKEINNYIRQCKLQLNLTRPDVTDEQRAQSNTLVDQATESYKQGNLPDALNKVNRALVLWEDNRRAKDLRYKIRGRMGETVERPRLSKENLLKFQRAKEAYKNGDYATTYKLTSEILRVQDHPEVRRYNKIAKQRMQG